MRRLPRLPIPASRPPLRLAAFILLTAFVADPAAAQERSCSWDACALRVEGARILQGVAGEPRGRVMLPGIDVAVLSEGPDLAAAYAARFAEARPQSDLWATFGDLGRGLALTAWIYFAMADDASDGWAWTAATLMPISESARSVARRQDAIADRALERAIFWYNGALAPPPMAAASPAAPIPAPAVRMQPLPADRSVWDLAPLAGGIVGGLLTNVVFDDAGWIVTGVLFGTSLGNGIAQRRLDATP